MPGDLYFEELEAYKSRFLPLLKAEQEEDEKALKERLSTWSLERLKREGYCLTSLTACFIEEDYYGRPVAEFTSGPYTILPYHRFEEGTQALVSLSNPLDRKPIEGTVVAVTDTKFQVCFTERFAASEEFWRVDLGLPKTTYLKMREAIKTFAHDPAVYEKSDFFAGEQSMLIGTYLRDILLRSFSPSQGVVQKHGPLQSPDDTAYPDKKILEHPARTSGEHSGAFTGDMFIHSWVKRHLRSSPLKVEGDPDLRGLNGSQVRAIALMIGERMSLVQGPPGTGKTRTIIETIRLLKKHFMVPQPLLVCTFTNVAIDNLVEGLISAGVAALRVGGLSRVGEGLVQYTLDSHMQIHPLRKELNAAIKEKQAIKRAIKLYIEKIADMKDARTDEELSHLKSNKRALEVAEKRLRKVSSVEYRVRRKMEYEIISNADVVCTTCHSSTFPGLKLVDFPVVFIDEASMSTEPASLIPLMRGSRHVSLIGDHKQLPPVITSREAQNKGLGMSLFERLTEEGEVPSIMLDTQYRMHPAISRFPAEEFYNNKLQDGIVDLNGHVRSELRPPASMYLKPKTIGDQEPFLPSLVFLDHDGSESKWERSTLNWDEAHIVCSIVEDLLLQNEQVSGRDIGIIAPYKAQISLLKRLLNSDLTYRERFMTTLGKTRAAEIKHVEIKTVDGFEGREKDVIIFSTVRNNTDGRIGFLDDRRRLNVGLTRAKRGLFVVGSLKTFQRGIVSSNNGQHNMRFGKGLQSWQRYVKYLRRHNLVIRLQSHSVLQTLNNSLSPKFETRRSPPVHSVTKISVKL